MPEKHNKSIIAHLRNRLFKLSRLCTLILRNLLAWSKHLDKPDYRNQNETQLTFQAKTISIHIYWESENWKFSFKIESLLFCQKPKSNNKKKGKQSRKTRLVSKTEALICLAELETQNHKQKMKSKKFYHKSKAWMDFEVNVMIFSGRGVLRLGLPGEESGAGERCA